MDPTEVERKPRRNMKAFIMSNHEADLMRTESLSSLSTASLTSILHHESYESGVSDLENSDSDHFDAHLDDVHDTGSERFAPKRNEHEVTFTKYAAPQDRDRGQAGKEPRASSEADAKAKRAPKRDISSKYSFQNWVSEKRKQTEAERARQQKKEAEAAAQKEAEEKRKRERAERGSAAFKKWMEAKFEREREARRLEAETQKLKAAMKTKEENKKAENRRRLETNLRERDAQRTRSAAQREAEQKRRERETSEQRTVCAQRRFVEWLRSKAKERTTRQSLAFANGRVVRYYDGSANPPVTFRQQCDWRGVLDANNETDAAVERDLEQRINDLLVADS